MKLALKRAVLAVKRTALCYVIASIGSFQNAFHPHALNLFLNARTALFIESWVVHPRSSAKHASSAPCSRVWVRVAGICVAPEMC